jgi:mono/diheme cytochrome c family protein
MLPQPRDFTRALYQIRTTASGQLPRDEDLRRVIDEGMPGSTMPGWRGRLSAGERDDVIAFLKTFSRFFASDAPAPLAWGADPGASPAAVTEGRRLYREEAGCLKCHGEAGRGDGPSAPTLIDDWDLPVIATDLTEPWNFNGGGTVEDIYRRVRTGMDGTPMPSYSDAAEAAAVTDEQLWLVAHYVRSLAPSRPPRLRHVIRAVRSAAPLPTAPWDTAWAGVEPSYVPLAGQIIRRPRQFAPGVDALWVQAMHDGERLALRLVWNDRTESPNPEWEEHYQLLRSTLTDADGPLPDTQGPDRVVIQWPLELTDGEVLPYFLGGDAERLVSQVVWSNASPRLTLGTATGLGEYRGREAGGIRHRAAFADGQWQLQVDRPLTSPDPLVVPSLPVGVPVPIAFRVADGSQGDGEFRAAVSAWYGVYLDAPTPTRVYVQPLVAGLLTAGLGLAVVFGAQRRSHTTS